MKKQYYAYPGHGIGELLGRETKEILGNRQVFLSIRILDSGMRIMVPENAKDQVGLRKLMDRETAKRCHAFIVWPDEHRSKFSNEPWNTRYRAAMESIKSGEPLQIAQVIADLENLKVDKELSFGERKMLDTAKSFLLREIDLVLGRGAALEMVQAMDGDE